MKEIKKIISCINKKSLEDKVSYMNMLKKELHKISPFKNEPVDCVLWVKNTNVYANDYNPNSVAPPEMKLLKLSILNDGYTQPIVTMKDNENKREVVDGFHRNRVSKEDKEIKERIFDYVPVVSIRKTQKNKGDRIASTIRHNRARGKHKIEAMSEIVLDLKKRNWSDKKIGKQLGMDQDEVLRLTQITGLAEMFKNKDFSEAWKAENEFNINDETKII